jgi:ribosomal protein S18 acetylase RimI-like enzyme
MIKTEQAQRNHVQSIYDLIVELAVYEKEPDQVSNTPEQLEIDLFDDHVCDAIVALDGEKVIGFALFYTSYSTWKGRSMYLEDFYVKEDRRKEGAGKMLFQEVVEIAKKRKVQRMDWQVLEWNQLALDFYKRQNALLDPEWVNGRLFFEY